MSILASQAFAGGFCLGYITIEHKGIINSDAEIFIQKNIAEVKPFKGPA
jgi:hypothetical protein